MLCGYLLSVDMNDLPPKFYVTAFISRIFATSQIAGTVDVKGHKLAKLARPTQQYRPFTLSVECRGRYSAL